MPVTVRRVLGAQHAAISSPLASAADFHLGLALIKAHWQHAVGVSERFQDFLQTQSRL